jgi:hypothetical protein
MASPLTDDEQPMGTYVVLRESNIEKVMKLTGHDEAVLRRFLDHAAGKGRDRVRLPLVPQHLLQN